MNKKMSAINNILAEPLDSTAEEVPAPEAFVGPTAESVAVVELPPAVPVPVPDGPTVEVLPDPDVVAVPLSLKPATRDIPRTLMDS